MLLRGEYNRLRLKMEGLGGILGKIYKFIMKKILIVLSILLNVSLVAWIVFDDVLEKEIGDYFSVEGDSDDDGLKEIEKKFGVSSELIEETGESIEECSQNFVCMMAVQFVYYNGFLTSLNEFDGHVYACKSVSSPITILSVEDESNDVFKCVKMTKKYKGMSVGFLESEIQDAEKYDEVVVE